jgi:phospholipid/cholesterol/gamma-HCH transport system substrate-binding protein
VKDDVAGAAWRFGVFVVVCCFGLFALFAIFGQWRLQTEQSYKAEFVNVSGLKKGDFVRVAGVEVGKVKNISISPQSVAVVEFAAEGSVVLTEGTKALIRWADPIGGRYLALEEGAGGMNRLNPGQTIPVARTEPALDLDALLGGFKPLFRALQPEQVNALTSQLIEAFQGQGATVGSFLQQAAAFTNTLADRDQLIGQVVTNLNTVLGSFADQTGQFGKAVDSLSALTQGLAARKAEISTGISNINSGTAALADLIQAIRPSVPNVIHQTDRVSGLVVADHDYFDNLLNTLPDTYKMLGRLGLYGDFFSFYLCDAILKVNGKGGQPVYIKLAGQDTGRCAPK